VSPTSASRSQTQLSLRCRGSWMQERGGRQEWGARGGRREDERCTKLKKKTHLFEPSQKCKLLVMLCVHRRHRFEQPGHETCDGSCFGFWAGFVWGTWC